MDIQGKRVEIPTYTNAWMRGDRYGEVVATRGTATTGEPLSARVMLDKSGTLVWVAYADVKVVES